jgi:hypothetical protein
VVAAKLGVGALERRVTRSLRLRDTVREVRSRDLSFAVRGIEPTRCGAPSSPGYAGSCSLTLSQMSVNYAAQMCCSARRTGHGD